MALCSVKPARFDSAKRGIDPIDEATQTPLTDDAGTLGIQGARSTRDVSDEGMAGNNGISNTSDELNEDTVGGR